MTDALYHYVTALQAQPAFEAYQQDLRARFEYLVGRLIAEPPETPHAVLAAKIGELRGLREAIDTPGRIARENE